MPLIYCPECGHEISNSAVACPSCGRPINPPAVLPKVAVTPPPRERGIPPWVFVSLGILGVVLLMMLFFVLGRDDTAEDELSVNVNARRAAAERRETRETSRADVDPIDIPPSSAEAQSVTIPGSQTTISQPPAAPRTGTVVIDARVITQTGSPQAVKNEKFYLLDKDLETILMDADLEPIEGQSLVNSFGLSVMYPERYGSFNRQALQAIKNHIKYAGQTDLNGKAQLGGVEPDSYYLFGVTKTGRGFAVWSSPVTVINGENILNLSPQRLTEIRDTTG
jgi:hypothetical protein